MDVRIDRPLDERQQKLVKQLLDLFEAAKKERQKVEPVWDDISDYVLPRLTEVRHHQTPKPKRYGEKLYTSAPISALRLASNGTSGYMMPRTSVWFRMEPTDKEVMNLPGVRAFYQDTTDAMHSELNRSNFYGEMTPVLDHGFSIGTSTLFVEDDEERGVASLVAVDPMEVYVSENKYKRVDTFFRYTWMTGQRLIERFPDAIQGPFEDKIKKNPYEMHAVLHCIYKRNDRIHERIDAENKQIASVYILVEKQHLLRESGFDFPRMVSWRHTRMAGTPYGGSPSWDALVDIMRLNSHSMDLLDASHLAVRPPMTYPAEMHDIDISPNGLTPYTAPGRVPHRLDVLGDYPVGRDREEAIEKAIRDHFQTDFFLLLTQSDRQKTAFEVSEMAGERAAVMSTVIGRIESELIDPVLEIIYRIAYDAGRMPPVPDVLIENYGGQFKWEYVGPLAQLQKRHHGQQARGAVFAEIVPMFEVFPEARDLVNHDELVKEAMHEGGLSDKIIRPDQEVAQLRQMRAQMEMQMREQEMAIEAAKATKGQQPQQEQLMPEEGERARATPRDL